MNTPTFLIIGTARAGTTSLYHYLNQHPQVYMSPIPEPAFFALQNDTCKVLETGERPLPSYSTSWEAYLKLFDRAHGERALGEASSLYIYHPQAPERIAEYLPEIKMIAMLRDPIERAISQYLCSYRDGLDPCPSFEEAVKKEDVRIKKGLHYAYHYTPRGLYAEQLERYLDYFDRDQLRVYLYDDLKSDSSTLLRDVFDFIGVDPAFTPDTLTIHNPSGVSRFPKLSALLNDTNPVKPLLRSILPPTMRLRVREWERQWNTKPIPKPEISAELRENLLDYYRDDILRLQELIDRDLSEWLRTDHVT